MTHETKPPHKFIVNGNSVYKLQSQDEKKMTYLRYDNDEGRDDMFWVFKTQEQAATKAAELNANVACVD